MSCNNCNEIITPDCTKEICDFVVPAKCVSVESTDCTGAGTLQEVVEELCNNVGVDTGECNCEVNTYTINSVCTDLILNDTEGLVINMTPHFTAAHPVGFTVYSVINSSDLYISNLYSSFVDSVTENVPITVTVINNEGRTITYDNGGVKTVKIRVIDSLGNYSNEFEIAESAIVNC